MAMKLVFSERLQRTNNLQSVVMMAAGEKTMNMGDFCNGRNSPRKEHH